ncbi:MAG: hypothetical protein ABIO70_30225 [Pseudomonadota bacterium]
MLRTTIVPALAALSLLSAPARAAEVTELPPFLRGDLALGYAFEHEGGSLTEAGEQVGSRNWQEHRLVYSGVFSAGPGVALFFELPQAISARLAFPEASQMAYDPALQRGTMLDTDPLDGLDPIEAKGAEGVWLGIKGTPFSEAFVKRGNRATWLIEAAFRTRTKGNFYTQNEDGTRSAGVGGGGTRLGMAFSTTRHISQPYLAFRYTRTRSLDPATLYDQDGTVLDSAAVLDPPDTIEIRTGTEIVVHDSAESHSRFAFDLRLGFGYATWQTIPSGLYLPSVLDVNRDVVATESEYTWAGAGLGLRHQAFEYMAWNLGADVNYIAPHRVEHLYAVDTGPDTLQITGWGGFKVMIR